MADSLRLQFSDDGDGSGELTASVSANGFAGVGGAWFGVQELIGFARSLAAYPLEQPAPALVGGFFTKESPPILEHEHLGIGVYPVGTRGQVGVQVRIATELWGDDRPERQHMLRAEVLTTYERLGQFSRDLLSVIDGSLREATLEREDLAG